MEDSNSKLPRVLITSSNREKAKEIANKMGAKFLSEEVDFTHYLLDIDNKYYTAQLLLCLKENLPINPINFDALIIYHDLETEDKLKFFNEEIIPIVSQSEADVLLLVCDSIPNVSLREKVIHWCTHRNFELIELDLLQSKDIMDLEDDPFKYGIDRIIECLETHMWSNMNLKDQRKTPLESQPEVNEVGDQLESVKLTNVQDFSERLQMESVLDGIMDNENADFGELFSNLRSMKEHAASMPSSQRRIAAEQLVTAFWKAIGGDPSEIDDID